MTPKIVTIKTVRLTFPEAGTSYYGGSLQPTRYDITRDLTADEARELGEQLISAANELS